MRRFSILLSALATAAALPASADVLVTVDKATQRMNVAVDGQDRYSWPVSTGVAAHDTPSGSYTPFRMDRDHFSKEWDDAPMPNSIFFTGMGHAIHGTGHVAALGRPASHGCVRLSRAHAAELFALVKAQGLGHTRVVVEGDDAGATEPVDPGAGFARYDRARTGQDVVAADGYGDGGLYADDPALADPPRRRRATRARAAVAPTDDTQDQDDFDAPR